jgi:hypothetical protein
MAEKKPCEIFTWERIKQGGNYTFGMTERAKIPEGWLVRTFALEDVGVQDMKNKKACISPNTAMVKIIDPEHEWDVWCEHHLDEDKKVEEENREKH